jgi:hypothetical protein
VEVFEVMVLNRAIVEKVGAVTVHHKSPILYRKSSGLFTELPSIQIFAVEEGNEVSVISAKGSQGEQKSR